MRRPHIFKHNYLVRVHCGAGCAIIDRGGKRRPSRIPVHKTAKVCAAGKSATATRRAREETAKTTRKCLLKSAGYAAEK